MCLLLLFYVIWLGLVNSFVPTTICGNSIQDTQSPCLSDVYLLGNNVNIGFHQAASFGTSNALENTSYYSSKLSCIANIYAHEWVESSEIKPSESTDNIEDAYYYDYYGPRDPTAAPTMPNIPFAGDFFVPSLPLEGWILGWTSTSTLTTSTAMMEGLLNKRDLTTTEVRISSLQQAFQSVIWSGNNNQFLVRSVTHLRNDGMHYVTTVTLKNIGLKSIKNVYYVRTADPDNDYDFLGTFATRNYVQYQPFASDNSDCCLSRKYVHLQYPNTAMVVAVGAENWDTYVSLLSVNPHARVSHFGMMIYNPVQAYSTGTGDKTWRLYGGRDMKPNAIYASRMRTADESIHLAFKYSEIKPGEVVTLNFAYAFNRSAVESIICELAGLTVLQPTDIVSGSFAIFAAALNISNQFQQFCSQIESNVNATIAFMVFASISGREANYSWHEVYRQSIPMLVNKSYDIDDPITYFNAQFDSTLFSNGLAELLICVKISDSNDCVLSAQKVFTISNILSSASNSTVGEVCLPHAESNGIVMFSPSNPTTLTVSNANCPSSTRVANITVISVSYFIEMLGMNEVTSSFIVSTTTAPFQGFIDVKSQPRGIMVAVRASVLVSTVAGQVQELALVLVGSVDAGLPRPTSIVISNQYVDENLPNNTIVGTLSWLPYHINSDSIYTLIDDANGKFMLDPRNTSRLLTNDPFDYEMLQPSHALTVLVMVENGNVDRVACCAIFAVTVFVRDIPESPTGIQPTVIRNISSFLPPGSAITNISIIDPDFVPKKYSIIVLGSFSNVFNVKSGSRELRSLVSLQSFAGQSIHIPLEVITFVDGTSSLSPLYVTITIHVDSRPNLLLGARLHCLTANCTISASLFTRGINLGTLKAIGDVFDLSAGCFYHIPQGVFDDSPLGITNSDQVFIGSNELTVGKYFFTVDLICPFDEMSSQVSFEIVEDPQPIPVPLMSTNITCLIPEYSLPGTLLMMANANCTTMCEEVDFRNSTTLCQLVIADAMDSRILFSPSFSILSQEIISGIPGQDALLVTIDGSTGQIAVLNSVSFNRVQTLDIKVLVSCSPQQIGLNGTSYFLPTLASICIHVINTNQMPHRLSDNYVPFSISNLAVTGTIIATNLSQFIVDEDDLAPFAAEYPFCCAMLFLIVNCDPMGASVPSLFQADPTTGEISVAPSAAINADLFQTCLVCVSIRDKGGLSTMMVLNVSITDEFVEPTISFYPRLYLPFAEIQADAKRGTLVTTDRFLMLESRNKDIGQKLVINVSPLDEYGCNAFGIAQISASLSVSSEFLPNFNLTILAGDIQSDRFYLIRANNNCFETVFVQTNVGVLITVAYLADLSLSTSANLTISVLPTPTSPRCSINGTIEETVKDNDFGNTLIGIALSSICTDVNSPLEFGIVANSAKLEFNCTTDMPIIEKLIGIHMRNGQLYVAPNFKRSNYVSALDVPNLCFCIRITNSVGLFVDIPVVINRMYTVPPIDYESSSSNLRTIEENLPKTTVATLFGQQVVFSVSGGNPCLPKVFSIKSVEGVLAGGDRANEFFPPSLFSIGSIESTSSFLILSNSTFNFEVMNSYLLSIVAVDNIGNGCRDPEYHSFPLCCVPIGIVISSNATMSKPVEFQIQIGIIDTNDRPQMSVSLQTCMLPLNFSVEVNGSQVPNCHLIAIDEDTPLHPDDWGKLEYSVANLSGNYSCDSADNLICTTWLKGWKTADVPCEMSFVTSVTSDNVAYFVIMRNESCNLLTLAKWYTVPGLSNEVNVRVFDGGGLVDKSIVRFSVPTRNLSFTDQNVITLISARQPIPLRLIFSSIPEYGTILIPSTLDLFVVVDSMGFNRSLMEYNPSDIDIELRVNNGENPFTVNKTAFGWPLTVNDAPSAPKFNLYVTVSLSIKLEPKSQVNNDSNRTLVAIIPVILLFEPSLPSGNFAINRSFVVDESSTPGIPLIGPNGVAEDFVVFIDKNGYHLPSNPQSKLLCLSCTGCFNASMYGLSGYFANANDLCDPFELDSKSGMLVLRPRHGLNGDIIGEYIYRGIWLSNTNLTVTNSVIVSILKVAKAPNIVGDLPISIPSSIYGPISRVNCTLDRLRNEINFDSEYCYDRCNLSYVLLNGSSIFNLDVRNGVLQVLPHVLDKEFTSKYVLLIKVTDEYTSLASFGILQVIVTDLPRCGIASVQSIIVRPDSSPIIQIFGLNFPIHSIVYVVNDQLAMSAFNKLVVVDDSYPAIQRLTNCSMLITSNIGTNLIECPTPLTGLGHNLRVVATNSYSNVTITDMAKGSNLLEFITLIDKAGCTSTFPFVISFPSPLIVDVKIQQRNNSRILRIFGANFGAKVAFTKLTSNSYCHAIFSRSRNLADHFRNLSRTAWKVQLERNRDSVLVYSCHEVVDSQNLSVVAYNEDFQIGDYYLAVVIADQVSNTFPLISMVLPPVLIAANWTSSCGTNSDTGFLLLLQSSISDLDSIILIARGTGRYTNISISLNCTKSILNLTEVSREGLFLSNYFCGAHELPNEFQKVSEFALLAEIGDLLSNTLYLNISRCSLEVHSIQFLTGMPPPTSGGEIIIVDGNFKVFDIGHAGFNNCLEDVVFATTSAARQFHFRNPSVELAYCSLNQFYSQMPRWIVSPCCIATNRSSLACLMMPGVGLNLVWRVIGKNRNSSEFFSSLSYAQPVISHFKLTNGDTSPAFPSSLRVNTGGGQLIDIHGYNFGTYTSGITSVRYRSPISHLVTNNRIESSDLSYDVTESCRISVPHTVITCRVSSGVGQSLIWTVSIDSQASSTPTTSYSSPIIVNICVIPKKTVYYLSPTPPTYELGCSDCRMMDSGGGQRIRLFGSGFGPVIDKKYEMGVEVWYGPTASEFRARNCAVTINDSIIECDSVPGAGTLLLWTVVVGGQISVNKTRMCSYYRPEVRNIVPAGCPTQGCQLTIYGGPFIVNKTIVMCDETVVSSLMRVSNDSIIAEIPSIVGSLLAPTFSVSVRVNNVSSLIAVVRILPPVIQSISVSSDSLTTYQIRITGSSFSDKPAVSLLYLTETNIWLPRAEQLNCSTATHSIIVCGRMKYHAGIITVTSGHFSGELSSSMEFALKVGIPRIDSSVIIAGKASTSGSTAEHPCLLELIGHFRSFENASASALETKSYGFIDSHVTNYSAGLTKGVIITIAPINSYLGLGQTRICEIVSFENVISAVVTKSSNTSHYQQRLICAIPPGYGSDNLIQVHSFDPVLVEPFCPSCSQAAVSEMLTDSRSLRSPIVDCTIKSSDGRNVRDRYCFAYVKPTVLSIKPTHGPRSGGFKIFLAGENFPPSSIAPFFSLDAMLISKTHFSIALMSLSVVNESCLVAVVPTGIGTDLNLLLDIQQTPVICGGSCQFSFDGPQIYSNISKLTIYAFEHKIYDIVGVNLGFEFPAVYLDRKTKLDIIYCNETTIVVKIPSGYGGNHKLTVSFPDSSLDLDVPGQFKYEVTEIKDISLWLSSPMGGRYENVLTTVYGENFPINSSLKIFVGTFEVIELDIICRNGSVIRFYAPPGYGENISMHLLFECSTWSFQISSMARFHYMNAKIYGIKTIDSTISTNSFLIVIQGINFGNNSTQVKIDVEAYRYSSLKFISCILLERNNTVVICIAPEGCMGSRIRVKLAIGIQQLSTSFALPAPAIQSISIDQLSTANDLWINIYGLNFQLLPSPIAVVFDSKYNGTISDVRILPQGEVALHHGRVICLNSTWSIRAAGVAFIRCRLPPSFAGFVFVSLFVAYQWSLPYEWKFGNCPVGQFGMPGEACSDCGRRELTGLVCTIVGQQNPLAAYGWFIEQRLISSSSRNSSSLLKHFQGYKSQEFATQKCSMQSRTSLVRDRCPVAVPCDLVLQISRDEHVVPGQSSCLGANQCAPGTSGDRCATCLAGYVKIGGYCEICPSRLILGVRIFVKLTVLILTIVACILISSQWSNFILDPHSNVAQHGTKCIVHPDPVQPFHYNCAMNFLIFLEFLQFSNLFTNSSASAYFSSTINLILGLMSSFCWLDWSIHATCYTSSFSLFQSLQLNLWLADATLIACVACFLIFSLLSIFSQDNNNLRILLMVWTFFCVHMPVILSMNMKVFDCYPTLDTTESFLLTTGTSIDGICGVQGLGQMRLQPWAQLAIAILVIMHCCSGMLIFILIRNTKVRLPSELKDREETLRFSIIALAEGQISYIRPIEAINICWFLIVTTALMIILMLQNIFRQSVGEALCLFILVAIVALFAQSITRQGSIVESELYQPNLYALGMAVPFHRFCQVDGGILCIISVVSLYFGLLCYLQTNTQQSIMRKMITLLIISIFVLIFTVLTIQTLVAWSRCYGLQTERNADGNDEPINVDWTEMYPKLARPNHSSSDLRRFDSARQSTAYGNQALISMGKRFKPKNAIIKSDSCDSTCQQPQSAGNLKRLGPTSRVNFVNPILDIKRVRMNQGNTRQPGTNLQTESRNSGVGIATSDTGLHRPFGFVQNVQVRHPESPLRRTQQEFPVTPLLDRTLLSSKHATISRSGSVSKVDYSEKLVETPNSRITAAPNNTERELNLMTLRPVETTRDSLSRAERLERITFDTEMEAVKFVARVPRKVKPPPPR